MTTQTVTGNKPILQDVQVEVQAKIKSEATLVTQLLKFFLDKKNRKPFYTIMWSVLHFGITRFIAQC